MIKAICINDKDKPSDVPNWIEQGEMYTIKHVTKHVTQNSVIGAVLKEINIERDTNGKYSAFKMSRFAINVKDLHAFFELCSACAELDNFSYEELMEEVELVEQ
jgi:hypothetical protein